MKKILNQKILIIISWAAVLALMVLIFNFSAQVAEESNELSTGITEKIVKMVASVVPNQNFDVGELNHFVRKNAHFFVYLTLGLLVINAWRRSGVRGFKSFVFSLAICVLYATSDEVHQLFVPGRGGQVSDVLLDSAGATVGIGLYFAISRIKIR